METDSRLCSQSGCEGKEREKSRRAPGFVFCTRRDKTPIGDKDKKGHERGRGRIRSALGGLEDSQCLLYTQAKERSGRLA